MGRITMAPEQFISFLSYADRIEEKFTPIKVIIETPHVVAAPS